jgi:hypothetical protein
MVTTTRRIRSFRAPRRAIGPAVAAALFAPTLSANARPAYLTAFEERYPTSTLSTDTADITGASCNVCHNPFNFFAEENCYRRDLIAILNQGFNIREAIAAVEPIDSDNDGFSNISEILFPRAAGSVGYNPGLIGPTGTDPCSTDPTQIITDRAETPVAVACAEDYNRDAALNLDDLSDFITDFYTQPSIPAGLQPAAPTYADTLVGFGTACPLAPDAPAPYAADAYRALGYRVGFSIDGSNNCPLAANANFPNLDNLSDFITAYYARFLAGGC